MDSSRQITEEMLLQAAQEAAVNAYAPYSRFPVGAALLTSDGEVITGVNVENASYGLTICAERVALASAIAQGKRRFKAIAVWASQRPHGSVTPCGACRQFLAEFFTAEGLIVMSNAQTGQVKMLTMGALLPEAFDLEPDPDGNCRGKDSNTLGD